MDITVRRVPPYVECKISDGNTTLDLGLLDEEEALDIVREFISAAEDLLPAGTGDAERKLAEIREGL